MTAITGIHLVPTSVAGAILALPLAAWAGVTAEPASGPYIHHLELVVQSVRAEVTVNGFPVGGAAAVDATPAPVFSPPVNLYLAGKRNVLEVIVDPSPGRDGKPLPMSGARVEVTVRRFAKGAVVEPGAGKVVTRYVVPAAALAELVSGKRKPPLTLTHPFASDGPDFSAELLDAAPFADEAALRDYAMKLRALAEKRDVDGLLAEFGPKVKAYAAAYATREATLSQSLKGAIARLLENCDVSFGRDDVELQACCGGRIWELRRKGGLPLLRSVPDADGPIAELPVFVAPRGGTLRVVR